MPPSLPSSPTPSRKFLLGKLCSFSYSSSHIFLKCISTPVRTAISVCVGVFCVCVLMFVCVASGAAGTPCSVLSVFVFPDLFPVDCPNAALFVPLGPLNHQGILCKEAYIIAVSCSFCHVCGNVERRTQTCSYGKRLK